MRSGRGHARRHPFSIYVSYPAAEIEFLIRDSGARVALVEQAFLEPMLAARRQSSRTLDHVIVIDGEAPEGVLALWRRWRAPIRAFDAAAAAAAVSPDDVLTLIYTSGTTGHPKGVELTHRAAMVTAVEVKELMEFPPARGSCPGCQPLTSPSGWPTTTFRSCSRAR